MAKARARENTKSQSSGCTQNYAGSLREEESDNSTIGCIEIIRIVRKSAIKANLDLAPAYKPTASSVYLSINKHTNTLPGGAVAGAVGMAATEDEVVVGAGPGGGP